MKKWNYKGVADITIGEIQKSKAPKIILTILLSLLTITIGLIIYFRDYLHDLAIIPEIILSTNEVSVELDSEFNAESYIINKGDNYSITGDIVDTSILNAEYTVIYNTWNRVNSSSTTLKVKIVDDIAPTIELKSNNKKIKLDENYNFTLILGESTDTTLGTNDFNIKKDIIVEVNDNHTSKEQLLSTLKITPENPDFTLKATEFSKNITIKFEIKDEVGLITNKSIIITVVNGIAEIPHQSTSSSSIISSTTSSSTSSSSSSSITSSSSNKPPISSSSISSSSSHKPSSSSSSSSSKPSQSSISTSSNKPTGAYINGVHDVTVPVGTGLQVIVAQLLEGVRGSGYVTLEYRKVNPTIPGVYTATFTSDDGVVKTCTVTVTE